MGSELTPSETQVAAGIYKLANEILSSIFEILEENSPNVSYLESNDWIFAATHTCQRWRNVALANPLLWTRIKHFNSVDLTKTIIQRSEGLKLSVLLRLPLFLLQEGHQVPGISESPTLLRSKAPALCLVLVGCGNRIERLEIENIVSDSGSWTEVNWYLQKSLPHLEVLSILVRSLTVISGFAEPPREIPVFPSFLQNVPSLKELSVSNISYRWTTGFRKLTGLVMLYLEHVNIQPSTTHLLILLGGCPELRELSLIDMHFNPEFNTHSEDHVVFLPHLQKLRILDFDYDECVELLRCLHINQPIIWEISCDGHDAPVLSSRILKHIELTTRIEVFASLLKLEVKGYNIKNGTVVKTSDLEVTEMDIMMDLCILTIFRTVLWMSAWSCTQEFVVRLDRMDDDNLSYYDREDWSHLFKSIGNVVSLTVVHSKRYTFWRVDRDFAQALSDSLPEHRRSSVSGNNSNKSTENALVERHRHTSHSDSESDSEESASARTYSAIPDIPSGLTNLKHLTLENFEFAEDESEGKDFCKQLTEALSARGQRGYRLESLDISTCRGVSKKHVEYLSYHSNTIKYR